MFLAAKAGVMEGLRLKRLEHIGSRAGGAEKPRPILRDD